MLAGAVAFRFFLFIVPYVFVIVVGLGLAGSATHQDPNSVAKAAGGAGLIASSIRSSDDLSLWNRILVTVIATFALISAGRTLLRVLWIEHTLVWRTRIAKPRRLTRASLMLVAALTVTLVVVGLIGRLRAETFVGGIVAIVIFSAVPFGLWLLISRSASTRRRLDRLGARRDRLRGWHRGRARRDRVLVCAPGIEEV